MCSAVSKLHLRPGTPLDTPIAFEIFTESLADLNRRTGVNNDPGAPDPFQKAHRWEQWMPLYEHLAITADEFWIAECDGKPVGYARSIFRDGARELTELFVLPGKQSTGAGGALLARVFPEEGAAHRTILSTIDERAQALYLRSGVYPLSPVYTFSHKPEKRTQKTDLVIEPFVESDETWNRLEEIDLDIIGYRRPADHAWLAKERRSFFYWRDSRLVGYGYVGGWNGPFALLEAGDFPAVLAHAENIALELGIEEFGLDIPLINHSAVHYTLQHGFRMGSFILYLMCDRPFGRLENYIVSSPEFFL
jgi:hypothetical protein